MGDWCRGFSIHRDVPTGIAADVAYQGECAVPGSTSWTRSPPASSVPCMDAFESLVGMLLRRHGYWTAGSVKVVLTSDLKASIGRPSSPRWEVDLVAYKAATNELLAVECKSYLDSTGVGFRRGAFDPPERYKLFTDANLRSVILEALKSQMQAKGMCRPDATVTLCLAAGKIAGGTDRNALQQHFDANGWKLIDDYLIRDMLCETVDDGYENDVALVVTKILRRGADSDE
jgi:hypothetical protein